jgi:hypothetical protein
MAAMPLQERRSMRRISVIFVGIMVAIAARGPLRGEMAAEAAPAAEAMATDAASILARSQISYRAEGGFSGVESYGAIISCVNGEISMMASIHDPRLPNEPMRKIGRLSRERYLALWDSLVRQASFRLDDGPVLDRDVLDEFTVTFNVSVCDRSHKFRAQGLSLPECARYQAVRALIDDAVQMADLWKSHDVAAGLTKNDEPKVTFETLHSNLDFQP